MSATQKATGWRIVDDKLVDERPPARSGACRVSTLDDPDRLAVFGEVRHRFGSH